MRQYKRILAAIGSAVLLISNLGSVTQTVFAVEQPPAEEVLIEPDAEPEQTGDDSTSEPDIDTQTETGDNIPAAPAVENPPAEPDDTGNTQEENTGEGTTGDETSGDKTDGNGQGSGDASSLEQNKTDPTSNTNGGTTPPADANGDDTTNNNNLPPGTTDPQVDEPTDGPTDPEPEDLKEYTNDEADGLTVIAKAADGTIPEGYELQVKEITDHDQLDTIAQQLDASDAVDHYDGFVAYDVYFANDDDQEKEPDGTVKITLRFDEATLPAGIDTSTLAIQHIDNSGDEPKVVTVADNTSKTDSKIDVAQPESNEFNSDDSDSDDTEPTVSPTPAVTATFSLDSLSPLVTTFLLGDGISEASISGDTTVKVGSSIYLSCSNGYYSCSNGSWSSSDTSIATINSSGYYAYVTGVNRGAVTITHTHTVWQRVNNQWQQVTETSTYDVTVLGQNESGAIIYALKTPDSDPDSNDGTNWTNALGNGSVNATTSDFNGGKNITNNPQQYMVSWPDGQTTQTWTLTSSMTGTSATYFAKVLDEMFTAYSDELKTKLGITDITKDNIKNITLTPYKISRNNGSTPDMHVDCKISITCEKTYDVKFWVKDVGQTNYANTYSVTDTYLMKIEDTTPKIDKVKEPDKTNTLGYKVGDTKVVDGITYRMTGWHTEDTTTHNAPSSETVDLTGEGYEPVYEKELYDDNVANYYAEWEALTGDLKVTKSVAGDKEYVDPSATYQVVIHLDGDENKNKYYDSYYFDGEGNCTVKLKDGDSITIAGITSGTTYTVTETVDSAKGYNVDYVKKYYTTDEDGNDTEVTVEGTDASKIYPEGRADVTVTNTKRVVKTGVETTDAPVAAILATIAMITIGTTAYHKARRYMH